MQDVCFRPQKNSYEFSAEQTPFVRHSFKSMHSPCSKANPEPATRSRNVWETRIRPASGKATDARADMHRDSREIVSDDLAFAGMQAATDLKPERMYRISNCAGTANGARGAVERREETIAGGVDLASAILLQHLANFAVELFRAIRATDRRQVSQRARRAHDIGEQTVASIRSGS